MAIENDKLPLPLRRKRKPIDASVLALPLRRKRGEVDTGGGGGGNDIDVSRLVANCYSAIHTQSKSVNNCQKIALAGRTIAKDYSVKKSRFSTIANCSIITTRTFVQLANARRIMQSETSLLANCIALNVRGLAYLYSCHQATATSTVGYAKCLCNVSAPVVEYTSCKRPTTIPTIEYKSCISATASGANISNCINNSIAPAVPVPCRFYPIPEPPPPPKIRTCRIRPPSSRLPLPMRRRRQKQSSNSLSLPLTCWHDETPTGIPNIGTYIVLNTITATVGGISVTPMSFNISTDMESYCWSGSVQICASDYTKIKSKLDAQRGQEPLINVVINGVVFTIIAEKQTRSREFTKHRHTLSGRSISARLGANYAQSQNGLLDQDNYASQIVRQQLNGLSVKLADFDIADWFIPANQYAVTNKTPIAVIGDIAAACGGFVSSHRNEATLSIKPRWKKPAWEIATVTPDVTVPLIARQITDSKRNNPRYNTIKLISGIEEATVFRKLQSRDLEAPTVDNPLYTDRDANIPAGTAILSDSGMHEDYSLNMRWADKYSIPLAELGQIWQVNDTEGAWRGVVKSVSLDVQVENKAPTVWQTINIDRYIDV